MRKLYKRSEDGAPTAYYEAWLDSDRKNVVEHFGPLGTEGDHRQHPINDALSDQENIDAVLKDALADGYVDIDPDDHVYLIVEYKVDGFGTPADLDKRHRLQDEMNQILGWTGLGHCDGGSIGSGTMEVACPVVDFELAAKVVAEKLAGTEFADFTRIYNEDK